MIRFSGRIYYTADEEATDEPFLYYIRGDRYSLMIDAGNSPEKALAFLKECENEGLRKPDLVVLSHWHWDHTFGLCALDIPSLSSRKTKDKLAEVTRWKWEDADMKKRLETGEEIPFCDEKIRVQYPDPRKIRVKIPDFTLEGKLVIDLGGIHAECETIDTPHTRDALVVRIPEEGVLIAADAEYEDYYDFGGKHELWRLKNYIVYLENTEFHTYLRGHEEACDTKEGILKFLKNAYEKCGEDLKYGMDQE
ncbi:MAG: MBL fold metallo-hydrolase [Erysipelotrichales bacterium]|nr:MBL fold metallo-hydrolase [Erysipelotrichales bacterium]MBQ5542667.1 MBL fold metallo-hydrolase [Erysipelotrichales bacterium]